MIAWVWLGLALLATAGGQVLFKYASVARSRPALIAAILVFCFAPPASYFALKELSLATVYLSTALAQLAVVVASMLLFDERYTRIQWAGLSLILIGVVIFNLDKVL